MVLPVIEVRSSVTALDPLNSELLKAFDLVLIVENKSSLACWPDEFITSVLIEPVSEFSYVAYSKLSLSGSWSILIIDDSVIWLVEFLFVQYIAILSVDVVLNFSL